MFPDYIVHSAAQFHHYQSLNIGGKCLEIKYFYRKAKKEFCAAKGCTSSLAALKGRQRTLIITGVLGDG